MEYSSQCLALFLILLSWKTGQKKKAKKPESLPCWFSTGIVLTALQSEQSLLLANNGLKWQRQKSQSSTLPIQHKVNICSSLHLCLSGAFNSIFATELHHFRKNLLLAFESYWPLNQCVSWHFRSVKYKLSLSQSYQGALIARNLQEVFRHAKTMQKTVQGAQLARSMVF